MLAETGEHLQKSFCCSITLKIEVWAGLQLQYECGEGCFPAGHLYKCISLNVGLISKNKLSNGYWAKSWLTGVESRLLST